MINLEWSKIEGLVYDDELAKIGELCSQICEQVENPLFCEIGSYLGKSTVFLAQYGRVIAIDLGGDIADGEGNQSTIGKVSFPTFLNNLVDSNLIPNYVTPICGTSNALTIIRSEFDLVFIDGAHSYDNCTTDMVRCFARMKPDSIMVLHDYIPNHPKQNDYNVSDAVDDFKKNLPDGSFTFEVLNTIAILKFGSYK